MISMKVIYLSGAQGAVAKFAIKCRLMLTQRNKCYNITVVRKFLLSEELNGLDWSSYCNLGNVCSVCAGDTGRGYILTSIAHMKVLKALGYDNAWMAWIPFAQQVLGYLSGCVAIIAIVKFLASNYSTKQMFWVKCGGMV